MFVAIPDALGLEQSKAFTSTQEINMQDVSRSRYFQKASLLQEVDLPAGWSAVVSSSMKSGGGRAISLSDWLFNSMGITTWEMGYASPGFEILGWTFPQNLVFLKFLLKKCQNFQLLLYF